MGSWYHLPPILLSECPQLPMFTSCTFYESPISQILNLMHLSFIKCTIALHAAFCQYVDYMEYWTSDPQCVLPFRLTFSPPLSGNYMLFHNQERCFSTKIVKSTSPYQVELQNDKTMLKDQNTQPFVYIATDWGHWPLYQSCNLFSPCNTVCHWFSSSDICSGCDAWQLYFCQ